VPFGKEESTQCLSKGTISAHSVITPCATTTIQRRINVGYGCGIDSRLGFAGCGSKAKACGTGAELIPAAEANKTAT
jgi:hypothetical protein